MHSLVEHLDVPPEDRVPAVAEFLAAAGQLPTGPTRRASPPVRPCSPTERPPVHRAVPGLVAERLRRRRGVHVLWLTARLQDDPERRLNETAQFLMDVTAPGGFDPGAPPSTASSTSA